MKVVCATGRDIDQGIDEPKHCTSTRNACKLCTPLGSSNGYSLARKLDIPIVRVGFPIHDRIGGQRILHIGYRGAQELYDAIVNSLLEVKQEKSDVGYSYL